MRLAFLSITWAILLLCCGLVSSLTGCANIVPPQGGARDTIPPQLIKTLPAAAATRVNSRTLQFYFDEYIDVQQAQENLIVSPLPATSPSVESRLRDVTVKLRDSLLPNTTYSIDFGNAVKDFTEGNIAKGLRFVFSTGEYIDSLELSGTVVVAETGKTDSTLIVMLHRDGSDSALIKSRPAYISKLDRNGKFLFRHLPAGRFYLYALKDEGGTRRYAKASQLLAFADEPVYTDRGNDSLVLYAFASEKETPLAAATTPEKPKGKAGTDKRIRFQTNLNNKQQELLQPLQLTFESPLQQFDTAGIVLYRDSAFLRVDSQTVQLDSTQKVIRLQTPWQEGVSYHLLLRQNAVADSLGNTFTRTDTIDFTSKRAADYGKLRIRFRGLDLRRQPLLQWLQGEKIMGEAPLGSNVFSDDLFTPGEYQLRMVYDRNGNGKWDTGQFFGARRQPEKVQAIDKKLSVRPGVGNDYEIEVQNR